jgi:hypothetical protein
MTTPPTPPEPTSEPVPESVAEPTAQAPYADTTTPTPAEPPPVEPPPGTEPPAPVDNRKLILWFGGAVAALLLVLVLVAVYALFIHQHDTVQKGSPTTGPTSATAGDGWSRATDSATQTAAPPGAAGQATDGPLSFAVRGAENTSTVTDPNNEFLTKTAQGEFIVVHITVANTGDAPATFLSTLQKLKAAGIPYAADDEASFYLGGGVVDVNPGNQVETSVAFDVPPGTVPESIDLHGDPGSAGVELPL